MSTINKMCCLSIVAFSCEAVIAQKSFLASYTVDDHHFYSKDDKNISTDYERRTPKPELWVFGA
jgi:hypothetical protein